MAPQVQVDNPIASKGTTALQTFQRSAYSLPPVQAYGPAAVNLEIPTSSMQVHGSTVTPTIQVY